MRQPSLLGSSHRFCIKFQSKASATSSTVPGVWRATDTVPHLSRAFSSSPSSQRFKLQLSKPQQSAMAPEMTTLKGRPLDRGSLESILKRRFFYAPTAEIYGYVPLAELAWLTLVVAWLDFTTSDRLDVRCRTI
jgi:glycyl-tRNA synthetase